MPPKTYPNAPSQESVKCGYCSVSVKRKNLREHTDTKHGKNMAVMEKPAADQTLLSAHFSSKKKADDNEHDNTEPEAKTPRRDEDEALMIEDED